MSTGKKGYEFTVQGKFYAENPHGKNSLKHYKKLKFVLPEISTYVIGTKWETYIGDDGIEKKKAVPNVKRQNTLKCFKYMLKNYYLEPALQAKYPEYIRFQTFQITARKEITLDAKTMKQFLLNGPIDEMNESQLIQFIAVKDLNVDLKAYFDLADKIIAVEVALAEVAQDRPGIDRPLTDAEKDLLPPDDVTVSQGSEEDEAEIDAFI